MPVYIFKMKAYNDVYKGHSMSGYLDRSIIEVLLLGNLY